MSSGSRLFDKFKVHSATYFKVLKSILQLTCAGHLVSNYVVYVQECSGPSMLPTLAMEGDRLLVNKFKLDVDKLKVGELIVLKSPINPATIACKRVIGLPGDTVCYDMTVDPERRQFLTVPPGKLWVQGDNASNSIDSRVYGPLSLNLVVGKVLAKVFPNYLDLRTAVGNDNYKFVAYDYWFTNTLVDFFNLPEPTTPIQNLVKLNLSELDQSK